MANLSRKEAATRVRERTGARFSDRHLANLAVTGDGPPIAYFGRQPTYPVDLLDEWIAARMSAPVRSTSEARGLARAS